jgi:hypothetical protein
MELPVQGVVLGAMREAEYEQRPFTLQPNDWIVMTTDGTTEARNESRRLWGHGRDGGVHRRGTPRGAHPISALSGAKLPDSRESVEPRETDR